MKPEPPHSFEELQRLLALKRHETPPPTFFTHFADHVLERIESPEPAAPLTWWQRWGLDWGLKPALACGSGVAVCALLAAGVVISLKMDHPRSAAPTPAQDYFAAMLPPLPEGAYTPAPRPDEGAGSTAPVISPDSPSPFHQFGLHVQRVEFNVGAGAN
jgi:hypothetical protein